MTEPTTPPPLTPTGGRANTWNMLCHLAALLGYIGIPFGNLIGPFLIWQIKKHDEPSVVEHGKASLNFQLTVLLAFVAALILSGLFGVLGLGFLMLPVLVAVVICGVVFAIIAGIKANDGRAYRYPFSLRLIP